MKKLYYTIGEVAKILDENVSAVRFWADNFPKYIKPERNAKGNRLFREEDLNNLKQIHYLIKEQGMTLEGVHRRLEENKEGIEKKMEIVEKLKEIRQHLVEIQKDM